ncbi:MAG: hypothetical protein ACR2MD_11585 [Aridibacter sp.]
MSSENRVVDMEKDTSEMDDYIITLDIDWAPDWAIDSTAQILIEKNVKATWFVTHRSEAVDRLRERSDLFELGIHPNLLGGSTHGKTEDEVLTHIKEIVPEAVSMRTHGLYQSTSFLIKASVKYEILADVSLFLPRSANLVSHQVKWNGAKLRRIPYFWEDDSEMFEEDPIWDLSDNRINVMGLRIFDFHPIHIALNTKQFSDYENIKQIKPVQDWTPEFIRDYTNKGKGPKQMFCQIADELSNKGRKIKDLILDNSDDFN